MAPAGRLCRWFWLGVQNLGWRDWGRERTVRFWEAPGGKLSLGDRCGQAMFAYSAMTRGAAHVATCLGIYSARG